MNENTTRRRLIRSTVAVGAASLGLGTAAANPGYGDGRGDGRAFGHVYANGDLWRTLVVRQLDAEPDPADALYLLHDGSKPVVARDEVTGQASPFVSGAAPGDRGWNGGKWVTHSAEVTDLEAFVADTPLTSESDVLNADYVEVTKGRPGFGPPSFFVCPLNGRA